MRLIKGRLLQCLSSRPYPWTCRHPWIQCSRSSSGSASLPSSATTIPIVRCSLNRVAVMWEASLNFLRKLKCLVGHGPMEVDTLLMGRGLFILDKHLRR